MTKSNARIVETREVAPATFTFRTTIAAVLAETPPAGDAPADGSSVAADGGRFEVVANSGKPMPGTFYWGTLAIDLSGVQGKQRIPALLDHDVAQRVGVFESRSITDQGLVMQGRFLKSSPIAAQLKQELADGFPFEASVRLQPIVVEEIADGASAEVNGYTLQGPASIFRQSVLRETSIVALGQDSQTSVSVAAGEHAPSPVSVEFHRSATPTMTTNTNEIAAAAAAAERTRIADLTKLAAPEQNELLAKLIGDGTSLEAATPLLLADLRTRFDARSQELARSATISQGNGNGNGNGDSATAAVLAMPNSKDKFAKLFAMRPKLQEEFGTVEVFCAFALEPVNAAHLDSLLR